VAKAEKETIRAGLEVDGVKETIRAFNKLDKDSKNKARDETLKVSSLLASRIRSAAPNDPRNQALGQSVRAKRDRVPKVNVGGLAGPTVSGGGGPRELVIGMEFGANQNGPNSWRFPPRTPRRGRGNEGYWIYPTLVRNQSDIVKQWQDSLEPVIKEWSD
jgi:hypothetical protein